ncbi:uncharacterized protein LOC113470769 [Diaphorina citri]|uniref:Uncharacterized protein LOC113470769 n=1 Tax=Diaphorina citri TaxID=121845 RepID=A0A3Q0J9Z1_DIACI|nr:uncharacterized protein LOC113470769 [Diaphorina citri]
MAVKLAAIVCFVYLAQFGSCLPAADPALDIPVQGLHNPVIVCNLVTAESTFFAFKYRMLTKDNINLFEGVTVVKTLPITNNGDGAPRAMPVSGDVESMITSRLENFLSTHTLKIDLKGIDVMNALTRAGRSISDEEDEEDVEARGKHDIIKKNTYFHFQSTSKYGRDSISDEEDEEDVEARGKHDIIKKRSRLVEDVLLKGKYWRDTLSYAEEHKDSICVYGLKIVFHSPSMTEMSKKRFFVHHDSYGGGAAGGDSYGGGHGGGWGRSSNAQDMAYSSYKPVASQ